MQEIGQVVEGVYAAKSGLQLAKKYDVSMPIIETMNQVLFEDMSARDAVKTLMERDRRLENQKLDFLY